MLSFLKKLDWRKPLSFQGKNKTHLKGKTVETAQTNTSLRPQAANHLTSSLWFFLYKTGI